MQRESVKQVMFSGNSKVYCSEKQSNRAPSSVGPIHNYSNKMESTLKRRTYVMYVVHVLLLYFSVKLRLKLNYNVYTLVRLLPVEYEKGEGSVERFQEVVSRELETYVFEIF